MRFPSRLLGAAGVAVMATALISLTVFGCLRSHSPVAPQPQVPEPPFGKMVADINGIPWDSNRFAKASPPIMGDLDALYVAGFGDSLQMGLKLPGVLPAPGTYRLADDPSSHASCFVLTANGWIGSSTDASHIGSATVTRVDSSSIAGYFTFDASDGAIPPHVTHVSAGAFNVPVQLNGSTQAALELQPHKASRP